MPTKNTAPRSGEISMPRWLELSLFVLAAWLFLGVLLFGIAVAPLWTLGLVAFSALSLLFWHLGEIFL